MSSPREPLRPLRMLALGGVALLLRALAIVLFVPKYRPVSDADQYLELARNLAQGKGFAMQWPGLTVHATAFRPPAWPAVFSLWIRLFGDNPSAGRWLNVLIGSAVVVATYAVVVRCSGLRDMPAQRAGTAAALLVAVYPPLLANDITVLAEPLGHLLMLGLVAALVARRPVLAGLAVGALMLTKPTGQVVLVVAVLLAVAIARSGPRPWLAAVKSAALVSIAALCVAVPWMIRNSQQVHTSALVTSNGFNLSAIYSEHARAQGGFVDPVFDPLNQSIGARLLRLDEAKWSDTLAHDGLAGIREQPSYVASVVGRNLGSWFELTPGRNTSPESWDGRVALLRRLGLIMFYFVTPVGLYGLWRSWERSETRALAGVLLAFAAATTLVSLPLIAVPRLRGTFDIACCIGVGLLAATGRIPRCLSNSSSILRPSNE